MNKFIVTVLIACALVFFTSCSSDDMQNNSHLVGSWKLSAWNIEGGFDMNNDGIVNTNLLNEIDCVQNETLLFEANGVVSLNTTFNPDIEIVLLNGTDGYQFNVECDTEGIISLATSYSVNGNNISIGDSNAELLDGNQILMVFKNSIEIHNEDFTEILATKDLTLVYVKIR